VGEGKGEEDIEGGGGGGGGGGGVVTGKRKTGARRILGRL